MNKVVGWVLELLISCRQASILSNQFTTAVVH